LWLTIKITSHHMKKESKFSNLGVGVILLQKFPYMKHDPSIVYGVNVDGGIGGKKGGLELLENSVWEAVYYISHRDGKFSVYRKPPFAEYVNVGEFPNIEEAENCLIELIKADYPR